MIDCDICNSETVRVRDNYPMRCTQIILCAVYCLGASYTYANNEPGLAFLALGIYLVASDLISLSRHSPKHRLSLGSASARLKTKTKSSRLSLSLTLSSGCISGHFFLQNTQFWKQQLAPALKTQLLVSVKAKAISAPKPAAITYNLLPTTANPRLSSCFRRQQSRDVTLLCQCTTLTQM